MQKRIGKQTCLLERPIGILAASSVVGPKEGEGPLSSGFDLVEESPLLGMDSWEQAESELAKIAANLAVQKAGLIMENIDYILAGDLLNQSIGSTFGMSESGRPFLGIFGACSAIGEGLGIGAMLIDGGFAENLIVLASSHFCAAEKQFRFPLEFGSQRTPTSSWTVTGAGAVVLSGSPQPIAISSCTHGKIVDMDVKDANNMGAAMAAAAADTIYTHLSDISQKPTHYDKIVTGDLGYVGSTLLLELLQRQGYDISDRHMDCGIEIFDKNTQDTHNGGSGCGCAAATFSAYFYPRLVSGELSRILFVPTGALMSPTSVQQGGSIPGIAHAVAIERMEGQL